MKRALANGIVRLLLILMVVTIARGCAPILQKTGLVPPPPPRLDDDFWRGTLDDIDRQKEQNP